MAKRRIKLTTKSNEIIKGKTFNEIILQTIPGMQTMAINYNDFEYGGRSGIKETFGLSDEIFFAKYSDFTIEPGDDL